MEAELDEEQNRLAEATTKLENSEKQLQKVRPTHISRGVVVWERGGTPFRKLQIFWSRNGAPANIVGHRWNVTKAFRQITSYSLR